MYIGNNKINKIYVGTQAISKIIENSNVIFNHIQKTQIITGTLVPENTGLQKVCLLDWCGLTSNDIDFYIDDVLTEMDASGNVNFNDTEEHTFKFDFHNRCRSLDAIFLQTTVGFTSFDFTQFDMTRVTNCNSLFEGQAYLRSLNLSNVDWRNVTSIQKLFFNSSVNDNMFDTSLLNARPINNAKQMFSQSNFRTIDLSNMDFSNYNGVDGLKMMFHEVPLSSLKVNSTIRKTSLRNDMFHRNHPCVVEWTGDGEVWQYGVDNMMFPPCVTFNPEITPTPELSFEGITLTLSTVNNVRGHFLCVPDQNKIISSSSGQAGVPATGTLNEQFVLVRKDYMGENKYYIYSIGANKFAKRAGENITLSDLPETQFKLEHIGYNKYKIWQDNHVLNFSYGYQDGIIICDWTTTDDGNSFIVDKVADKDLTEIKNKIPDLTPMSFVNTTFTIDTLNSVRGHLVYNPEYPYLVSSKNGKQDVAPTGTLNEQFALVRKDYMVEGTYYLYSIGAKKFITQGEENTVANVLYTDLPQSIVHLDNIDLDTYKIRFGSNCLNITAVHGVQGVIINPWSTTDAGNVVFFKKGEDNDLTEIINKIPDPQKIHIKFNGGGEEPVMLIGMEGANNPESSYDMYVDGVKVNYDDRQNYVVNDANEHNLEILIKEYSNFRLHSCFHSCINFTSVDFTEFDLSTQTDINGLCYNCTNLKSFKTKGNVGNESTDAAAVLGEIYTTGVYTHIGDTYNAIIAQNQLPPNWTEQSA